MVLCGAWSETSVAQSQLIQFWQIPRHRTLSYSLWTPFFSRLPPSGWTWKYAKAPSTKKLGEILYLLICSFLPCLSCLLRSRVRNSRRDLWITLYFVSQTYTLQFRIGLLPFILKTKPESLEVCLLELCSMQKKIYKFFKVHDKQTSEGQWKFFFSTFSKLIFTIFPHVRM